ncbi:hypothetical protein F8568_003775 [Actinomadura sp. LD22]|uniref:Uncharacterized protein n=1 Tax=Actinomadura physcomitrii TaxID=2650748 RepID=A0A6I4M352_9ACTN|nr:hypothetical protein [Actinomadura physcomitrii]MVZ99509.1 hypothetical protein [Actinomadura physcomitrii]
MADESQGPHERPGITGRHYALAIAMAIAIGSCSVVGEALVPTKLPPQSPLGWAAFLGAVILFALTFAATTIMASFIGRVAASIPQPILGVELRERLPRITFAALIFATITIVTWNVVHPSRFVKEHEVGGVNLSDYCNTYNYKQNDQKSCFSKLPLDKACEWHYKTAGTLPHRMVMGTSSTSGVCYDSKNRRLGGTKDLPGYCRYLYPRNANVEAVPISRNVWICRVPIDMSLACSWEYQKRDIVARRTNGNWSCYT